MIRGMVVLVSGIFTVAVFALIAGVVIEPIADVVLASEAVQTLGWDSIVLSIRRATLRWAMLLGIVIVIVWAGMWAIRRGRTTGVRRR